MNTEKDPSRILQELLEKKFHGLGLRSPLFYRHEFGLRFDLEVGSSSTEEYFQTGLYRATELFNSVFGVSKKLLVVVQQFKYKPRHRLKSNSPVFRELKPIVAQYRKIRNLYESGEIYNSFICWIDPQVSNVGTVLLEIQERDFYYRMRRRRPFGRAFGAEVYFIDVERAIIFYMYDSRGVDIVSSRMEELVSVYHDRNDWILDYDRKTIDERFKKVSPCIKSDSQ